MANVQRFRAEIQDAGGGAYVVVPFDLEETFGKKRLQAKVTFDGHPYRGSVGKYRGEVMVIVPKNIREAIGKQAGDEVEVTIEEDAEPRVVEVPDDLAKALEDAPEARTFFESLSYTHKREYVTWIEEAKRAETRERRITKAVEMLQEGKKTR
jgi:bifunctional DNA-binding transcriptional regulator/antitoxin component of YhaV-PrlF toxin-antitoxin module